MGQLIQNTSATADALFGKVAAMMDVVGDLSSMEYELDTLAQLVVNLIQDLGNNLTLPSQVLVSGTVASGALASGESVFSGTLLGQSNLPFTLSADTQARLANMQEFLTYSSINFVALDANSPMENWKIPYALQLKAQVRDIQTWYLETKIRLFGYL